MGFELSCGSNISIWWHRWVSVFLYTYRSRLQLNVLPREGHGMEARFGSSKVIPTSPWQLFSSWRASWLCFAKGQTRRCEQVSWCFMNVSWMFNRLKKLISPLRVHEYFWMQSLWEQNAGRWARHGWMSYSSLCRAASRPMSWEIWSQELYSFCWQCMWFWRLVVWHVGCRSSFAVSEFAEHLTLLTGSKRRQARPAWRSSVTLVL